MWDDNLDCEFASQLLQLTDTELALFPSGRVLLHSQSKSLDGQVPLLRKFMKEMVENRLDTLALPIDSVTECCGKEYLRATAGQDVEHDTRSSGEEQMEEPLDAAVSQEREWRENAELTKRIMGNKKSHEVALMAQKCANLLSATGIKQVIDIGSGKGYLGQFLTMQYGINVISVDSSETNTNGALKRNNRLSKQWRGIVKNATQRRQEKVSDAGSACSMKDCRLESRSNSGSEKTRNNDGTDRCQVDLTENEGKELSSSEKIVLSSTLIVTESIPVQSVSLGDGTSGAVKKLSPSSLPSSVLVSSSSSSISIVALSSSSSCSSSSTSTASSLTSITALSSSSSSSSSSTSIVPSTSSSSTSIASLSSSLLSSSIASSFSSPPTTLVAGETTSSLTTGTDIRMSALSAKSSITALNSLPNTSLPHPNQPPPPPHHPLVSFTPSSSSLLAEEDELMKSQTDGKNNSILSQERTCHGGATTPKTEMKAEERGEAGTKPAACVAVTGYVDEETEIGDILQCDENASSFDLTQPFMMVGLHTCGDLAPSMLRIFQSNPSMHCLCNVGCCYHHVTEEFAKKDEWDREHSGIKMGSSFGFPMSDYLREKKVALGRGARMTACMAADRIASEKTVDVKGLFYRAVLQVICRDHFTIPTRKQIIGKLAPKCKSFMEYTRKALKKLKMDDTKISDDEISAYEAEYRPFYRHLAAYNQLRAALSPSIEAIILLDRLLYLKEQPNIKTACIVRLFDPVTSPRCYGIFAVKATDCL
ncbi:methyltransferase-like protein 25 [Strongylocentrotus purpuratus]|uniref:Methyltransferase domain-containing protein n=1 Tax=Strongylocentrotus purpuratus TaxID=7668 RepID=A0A7M7NZJ0_STRPU|nr:methyltransferase-like protein 25 [Strongylocentrotus purpuratus]